MVASKIKRLIDSVSGKSAAKKTSERPRAQALLAAHAAQIEETIGYRFTDPALLEQSLTHPSFLLNTKLQVKNNQRLEFLGDAVVQLALTERLYRKFPHQREGKLTALRSGYARGEFMAQIARRIKLDTYLLLKPKDREAGIANQDSTLADAFEALIGAVYLDGGWDEARRVVMALYLELEHDAKREGGIGNPKGKLQELIQPIHGNDALRYETTGESGQAHNREFEVSVFCHDQLLGSGSGRTKKEASEKAALQALAKLTAAE